MSDESEHLHCVCCREEIKKGAIKCTKCDTFQDWRRYISISNITLSLLIALIANMTALFTTIKSYAPKSIKIQAKDVKKESDYIQLAIANTGNTVAIVRGGTLKVKRDNLVDPNPMELRLFSAAGNQIDPSIEPNKGKLLDFKPYRRTLTELPRKLTSDKSCNYLIELDYTGIEKKTEKLNFETDDCLGVANEK